MVAPLVQVPGLLHTEFPWPGKRQDSKDSHRTGLHWKLLSLKMCYISGPDQEFNSALVLVTN